MKEETLEALRGSIEKWKGIVAGTVEDLGSFNCPLCLRFMISLESRCMTEEGEQCPVAIAAGVSGCSNTPYVAWDNSADNRQSRAANSEYSKKLAKAELDFLISLLPLEPE